MNSKKDPKTAITELFEQITDNGYSLVIKLCYIKKESKNHVFYGQIFPVKSIDEYEEEVIEYQNCSYVQEIIPNCEIKTFLKALWPKDRSLGGGNKVIILECGSIKIISSSKPSFQNEFTNLRSLREISSIAPFPLVFSINFSNEFGSASTRIILSNPNSPYFPQVDNLISNKFGFDIGINNAFQNTIHILIPSIKGHIEQIITEEDKNLVVVNQFTEEPLILKIYQEDAKGCNDTADHPIQAANTLIPIASKVIKTDMVLIDSNCNLLDQKQYDLEKLTPLDEVEKMILAGEGVETDFKRWEPFNSSEKKEFKEKRRKKYTKLICAFTNNNGGYILFGVDDEAEVIGIKENEIDKIETFLQEIIDRRIKPVITITRSEVVLKRRRVGVIHIQKSDKKVINLYNKRYYIRRGSTNRIMYPEEMNELRHSQSAW